MIPTQEKAPPHTAIRLPPKILCVGYFLSLQRNETPPEGCAALQRGGNKHPQRLVLPLEGRASLWRNFEDARPSKAPLLLFLLRD